MMPVCVPDEIDAGESAESLDSLDRGKNLRNGALAGSGQHAALIDDATIVNNGHPLDPDA